MKMTNSLRCTRSFFSSRLRLPVFLVAAALAAWPPHVFAAAPPASTPATKPTSNTVNSAEAIKAVLYTQAAAWNTGDLDTFARTYKNSPDILFIGKTMRRGYADMVAGYRERYGSREKMGHLTLSGLEVQPLDARFATATGHFHLERTAAGGGNADGFFLLVLEDVPGHDGGWKIVRDDSTDASALR